MTTNQTIDGVPLELIEKAMLACFETGHGITHDRLRALLDAPAENVIDVSAVSWAAIQEAASESTWMPPEYMRNDWVDDVCRFLREGPAAQPQGEPVAWRVTGRGGLTVTPKYPKWAVGELGLITTPLYAEQPAPVAFPGYPPVPDDRKLPAPVAVVMPEHREIDEGASDADQHSDYGWNACLDELKRLNPSL